MAPTPPRRVFNGVYSCDRNFASLCAAAAEINTTDLWQRDAAGILMWEETTVNENPTNLNSAGLQMLDIILITRVFLVYFLINSKPTLDEALTRNYSVRLGSEHICAKDPAGIDYIISISLLLSRLLSLLLLLYPKKSLF